MRTPFICGNWKMHLAPTAAVAFARELNTKLGAIQGVEIGIAPTFVALDPVKKALAGSKLRLFAQNCHWAEQGAFTGEVAPGMLKAIECDGAIVGHSERRQY